MTELEYPHSSIKSMVDSLTGPALLLPLLQHILSPLFTAYKYLSSPSLDWLAAPQRESLNHGGFWYCKRSMNEK